MRSSETVKNMLSSSGTSGLKTGALRGRLDGGNARFELPSTIFGLFVTRLTSAFARASIIVYRNEKEREMFVSHFSAQDSGG